MRIDYSEPKKSYVSPQGGSRPRKEPTGYFTTILLVTGAITFVAGFGTGWFLSQKSAKKSFQAATAQTSLENSPRKEPAVPPTPQANAPQPQTAPTTGQTPAAATETPLSFYKALPSGQKNTVLGSGINAKDEHNTVPLQAPLPANLNKPTTADAAKPANEKTVNNDKTPVKQNDSGGFTVQVASYPLKSEAETQKNKLAARGYHAYIIESNQGDKGTWYRVRVGKKLDHDAAKELSNKLGKTALVIPDKD